MIDYSSIVQAQRSFVNSASGFAVKDRILLLKKMAVVLKENTALLEDAIFLDFKKSKFDVQTTELMLIHAHIKEAIRNVETWAAKKSVSTNLINFPGKSYIVPEPLGVALIIGAWNYPYLLTLSPLVAAIAAGNTAVLKPSELPFHTSNAIVKIISENFDQQVIAVAHGGAEVTTELLKIKFDKIFFTGSTAVGKIVYQAAAHHLTPVTLELGGKSPCFVTSTCDLKMTVRRLVWAKFLNAGQTCIAPDYVLVDRTIEESFFELLRNEIEGSHFDLNNGNFVQIINERHMNRLSGLMDGHNVCIGGKVDSTSRTISPTVLRDISFDDGIMQEEIFGPLLPIISYENLDWAIAQVKMLPKPLALYIFTGSSDVKNRILKSISFGGGAINDAVVHISNSQLPYGGVGESGMGSYNGENGFKTFSHFKGILEKPTWFELNLKYFPHSLWKLRLIRFFMR